MTILYNTEQQTIESVTALLTAHGYDPAEYDLEKIAADYQHKPGLYNSVFANPSIVWGYVDNHHQKKENTMTTSKTIDPAELIATTLLASFSLEKMPFRAIAAASENTGVKASQIIEHLERVWLETEPQNHQ